MSKEFMEFLEENEKEYEKVKPSYTLFTDKLEEIIRNILKGVEFNFEVKKRTKDIESFRKKIIRKGYTEPFKQIHDLSGLRVVVRSLSDVEKVSAIIKQEFIVDKENSSDKKEELNPDQFGYASIHFIVLLPPKYLDLPVYQEFKNYKAEIQISTIPQDLWSGISHDYGYKSEQDIPKDKKRRIYRLAAILELIDSEIEGLITELALPTKGEKVKLDEQSEEMDFYEYLRHGYAYLNKGNVSAAKNEFIKLINTPSFNYEAYLMLGLIDDIMGNFKDSISHSQKALELRPESFVPQFNLAVATNHLFGYKKSLSLYLNAKEYADKQNIKETVIMGKLNLFIGHDYRDNKNIIEAKKYYSEAKRILEKIDTEETRFWLKHSVDNLLIENKENV